MECKGPERREEAESSRQQRRWEDMAGGMTLGFLPEAVGLRHPQKQELQEREGSAVCLRAQ